MYHVNYIINRTRTMSGMIDSRLTRDNLLFSE